MTTPKPSTDPLYRLLRDEEISGVFFPDDIAPEEIRLSVEFGTRLRLIKQSSG